MPNTIEATITRSTGPAFVERNGSKISLNEGDGIYESDLIITGSETTIDISFRDGTKSRIGPDSEMRLVDFEFGENEDASFVVNLTQGAMRTVTGEIVKLNPEAFEVITPRATAGIRGTEFITEVKGDTENHLVLYISGGSVMLVKGENGQTLSFDKPLQGTSIASDGSMQARSYSMTEMQSLINDIAPSIGGNIPTNSESQGDWSDANNIKDAKSSDMMAGVEVSIVYDNAETLETVLVALQESSGIIINSVTASPEMANKELEEITLLDIPSITDTYIEENLAENNGIFNTDSIFASLGGNHGNMGEHNTHEPSIKPEIKPEGGNYGGMNEHIYVNQSAPTGNAGDDRYIYSSVQGKLDAGNGDNSISISNVYSGADISAGSGNDTIYIDSITGGIVDAGNGNNFISINTLNNPNVDIITGSGNDTIFINGNYGGGDIITGAGNDFVYVNNYHGTSSDSINTGADNDIVNIVNSNGNSVNIDMGAGYDVAIIHSHQNSNQISNAEAFITGNSLELADIKSSSDLKDYGITITNNGMILDSSWSESNGTYTNSNNSLSISGQNITISSANSYALTIEQAASFA